MNTTFHGLILEAQFFSRRTQESEVRLKIMNIYFMLIQYSQTYDTSIARLPSSSHRHVWYHQQTLKQL